MSARGAARLLRADVPPPPPRQGGAGRPAWQPPTAPPAPPPPPGAGPSPAPSPGGPTPSPDRPAPDAPGRLLPLRPLNVGDVLDGTVSILRRGFKVLAAVVLLVHAPYQLLSALVLDRLLPELADPAELEPFFTGTVPVDLLTRLVLFGGISAIVSLLVHVTVGGAVATAIREFDRGRPMRAGAALRASVAVSGATLGASVLLLVAAFAIGVLLSVVLALLGAVAIPLAVILGVVALPLFGAAVLALTYLVLPIAVVEGTGPVRTLSRALWVLQRRFWWVIGVTLLAVLLVAAVSLALTAALAVATFFAGPAGFVVEAVSGTLSALISVPLTVGAAMLIHHDARVRWEGHDLRTRAQQPPWT